MSSPLQYCAALASSHNAQRRRNRMLSCPRSSQSIGSSARPPLGRIIRLRTSPAEIRSRQALGCRTCRTCSPVSFSRLHLLYVWLPVAPIVAQHVHPIILSLLLLNSPQHCEPRGKLANNDVIECASSYGTVRRFGRMHGYKLMHPSVRHPYLFTLQPPHFQVLGAWWPVGQVPRQAI